MFVATGVILFWKGLWEGVGSLPVLDNAWVDLFVGAVMLTLSGVIFSEFDPLGGIEKGALKTMNFVHQHPMKHEFLIKYFDSIKKKVVELEARHIKHIEKNVIVVHKGGKESFIPIHRVRSVHRKGELIWKL
jgi:uncharacterized protein (UPF0248 family)